jgi:transcriptional regulator with XRE-family HTH domain
MKSFSGKKLKATRQKAKLSVPGLQVKLIAAGCKVSTQSLYQWESGKFNPKTEAMMALADVLGRDIKEFFNKG